MDYTAEQIKALRNYVDAKKAFDAECKRDGHGYRTSYLEARNAAADQLKKVLGNEDAAALFSFPVERLEKALERLGA